MLAKAALAIDCGVATRTAREGLYVWCAALLVVVVDATFDASSVASYVNIREALTMAVGPTLAWQMDVQTISSMVLMAVQQSAFPIVLLIVLGGGAVRAGLK